MARRQSNIAFSIPQNAVIERTSASVCYLLFSVKGDVHERVESGCASLGTGWRGMGPERWDLGRFDVLGAERREDERGGERREERERT